MAFCMSKNSRSGLSAAQRPEQRRPRQSKSQILGKPPISTSPILQTQRQLKENMSRDQAAKQILSQRKKKSFVIKTSIQQTRFSKKDIQDLKDRFEKNSTWVLVNELGESLDAEGRVINYAHQQIQQQKQLLMDFQRGGNSSSNNNYNHNGSHKSDNKNPNNSNSGNMNINFQLQKQSPNTSFTNSEKGPIAKGFVKGGNYKKVEISLDSQKPIYLGIHYERKMSKNQFRNCMGLLGLESNAFLSDRIFEVVDSDNDQFITFAQFATIMDTLINGEEDEKHEFSFSLLDIYDTGYFDFEEFKETISKIIAHWCIITGSQVKVEREGLREIFDRMDTNKDGIVDIDEYKKALKGNPQLFQWFDLLNQGVQDGKKTQKDIIDIKLKALTDVLELQQKLNTVMSQMRNLEHTAQSQREYSSSKQSSSQFSNFGSSLSKQQRTSFKLEDFNKSLERKINQENDKTHLIKQKNIKSIEIQDSNFDKSLFRKILDGDENTHSPNSLNIGNSPFQNQIHNNNVDSLSISDQVLNQVFPKKALKKDSDQYQLQQMYRQKELLKQRKKEFRENKSQLQQPQKKCIQDQDEDIIDDPDSPPVIQKKFNQSQLNKRNQGNLQNRQSDQNEFIQSQVYHLFGKTTGELNNSNQRSITPNINYRNFASNENYQSRQEGTAPRNLGIRQNSNNSNNSQMRPEYQQSSQSNNFIISNHQQKLSHGNSRNNQIYSNSLQSAIKSQSQNPSLILQNYGYQSDWSPNQTQDGQRSEMNHPQGGGPANISHRVMYENLLVPNDQRSNSKKKRRQNKTQSIIEDIYSQNSQAIQIHNQNLQVKQQQAEIMAQLNDIQTLANHLLSQLQEDKDSVIGEQIKEYVEKQKAKIIINQVDNNSDEEEKDMNRISLNLDDGNLRPLNEIQSFFKVRSRQRLNESIKKSSHIHKPLSKTQGKSFIHIGHDNWNLVLHMMLGIRQSVRNVMHEEVFELIEQDFERKYCYELIAKKTKNMNVFEFYDFSPRVFHLIRTMYGITPDQYLKSIGPENLIGNLLMGNISSLKEQCSTGKSGSFFYYTADSNFMLKTISAAEFHNLRDILKEYYDHLAIYPHTLITRFFGLHKIKYSKANGGKARIYFVIMANVFKTARDINVRFDLKGSTQGRKTKKGPNDYVDSSVALKDLDFIEAGLKVKVSPDIQKALKQQMLDDVKLFQKLNINDYSLLLGIHQLSDEDEARQILQNSPSIHQIIRNSFDVFQSKEKLGATYNSQKLLRPPIPFYEAHDGGIISADGKCVYFIGIIDTLTFFGAKKKLEYSLKSVAYGNKTISCIPPKNYGDRFIAFMNNIFE